MKTLKAVIKIAMFVMILGVAGSSDLNSLTMQQIITHLFQIITCGLSALYIIEKIETA